MLWRLLIGVGLALSLLAGHGAYAEADPMQQLLRKLKSPGLADTARVRLNTALSELAPSSAEGVEYAEAAVAAARRTKDQRLLLRTLSVLADQYARAVQPVEEQRVAQQIMRLARELGNRRAEALSFLRLAMISDGQENHALAEDYFRRALALADKPGVEPVVAAQIRCQWGDILVHQQRYRQAQPLLEAALPVALEQQVYDLAAYCLDMLSRNALAQRDYVGARRYALSGLQQVVDHPDDLGTNSFLLRSELNGTLAATARALGDLPVALRYSRQALTDARQGKLVSSEIEVLGEISEIAAAQGFYAEAYSYQRRLKQMTDSLATAEKAAEVALLQTQFETREKQNAIKALTQANQIEHLEVARRATQVRLLAVGAIALLLLFLAAVGLYWQVNLSRRRVEASEARLRLAIQAKDRLYALIAHDLRGPVMSFAGLARMIGFYRRRNDNAGLDELTEEVDQASQHLATLLDNLLDWARVQSGDVVNQPQPMDPVAVVAEVVALYHPAAVLKQLNLVAEAPPGLPLVWADPNLLATVVRNLVNNAVKFTAEDGVVTVAATLEGAGVQFRVHNTGPGLTAVQVAAMMTPLDQRLTTGTAGERGTGLGLRISQSFAELLGGRLRAESAPGQGVWFSFSVPVAPPGSTPTKPAASAGSVGVEQPG